MAREPVHRSLPVMLHLALWQVLNLSAQIMGLVSKVAGWPEPVHLARWPWCGLRLPVTHADVGLHSRNSLGWLKVAG